MAAACKIFPVVLLCFLPAAAGSWRALISGAHYGARCPCRHLLRSSDGTCIAPTCTRSSVVAARRRSAAVRDGECFNLKRAALSLSRRTAVESASVAQLSAVLFLAATDSADAGAWHRRPAPPQGGLARRQDSAGVVGSDWSHPLPSPPARRRITSCSWLPLCVLTASSLSASGMAGWSFC